MVGHPPLPEALSGIDLLPQSTARGPKGDPETEQAKRQMIAVQHLPELVRRVQELERRLSATETEDK